MPCPIRCLIRCLTFWLALAGAAQAAPCPPQPAPPTVAELQAAAQRDRGLLWRIERDGRSSWLYGTLHLGRPAWRVPGPRVAAALAASRVLALELDLDDPAVAQALADDGGAAPLRLPQALAERLQRRAAAACLPGTALQALHPVWQTVLLSVLDARWLGLDAAFGQETALATLSRAAGRRIVSLETAAQQKALLVPAAPAEALAQVEKTLAQLESGSGRDTVARLARAWEEGDLATLEDHARWCDCVHDEADRAALRALNDDRNPALADGIAALHAQGNAVFAAVGALHMTGPASLPRLLAARGFVVERLHPRP